MWRVASLLSGKSYFDCPSFLSLNTASHTSLKLRLRPLPNPQISNASKIEVIDLLSIKCKSGFDQVEDAHALFDRMLKFQPLPSGVDFARLLTGLVKMEQYSFAIDLYREMRFEGVPIGERVMNIAINSLCQLKRVDFGLGVLASFYKVGFEPDGFTFGNLIRGLFEVDRTAEAIELFEMTVDQKICSEVTYAIVINGLCKCGNTLAAIELLHFVVKEGSHKADTRMYNPIVDNLCKEGKFDEALELISEMADNETPPDIVTYNSVIHTLCEFGNWDEARNLMIEMENTRIYPDVGTFNILVDGFNKHGLIEEAELMVKIMEERGQRPNDITYGALMHGYCLLGEMDRAVQVLTWLVKDVDRASTVTTYYSMDIVRKGM